MYKSCGTHVCLEFDAKTLSHWMKLAGVSSVCHHCFGRKLWSAEKFTTTNGHANIAPTPSQKPNQLWATIMSSVERTLDIPSALCTVTAVCPSFFGFFRLLCVHIRCHCATNFFERAMVFQNTMVHFATFVKPLASFKDGEVWYWTMTKFLQRSTWMRPSAFCQKNMLRTNLWTWQTQHTKNNSTNPPSDNVYLKPIQKSAMLFLDFFVFMDVFGLFWFFMCFRRFWLYFLFIFLHLLVSFQCFLWFCGFFLAIRYAFRYIPCTCFANFTCFYNLLNIDCSHFAICRAGFMQI